MIKTQKIKHFLFNLSTIIAIAFFVRLFFCLVAFPFFFQQYSTVKGQLLFDNYFEIAHNICNGLGYVLNDGTIVFHRPPLYAFFLTIPAFFKLNFSIEIFLIQLLNTIFACLGIFFAYRTSQLINNSSKIISSLIGYAIALWPYNIWISRLTIPENLLFFLVPLSCYLTLKLLKSQTVLTSIILGIVLASLWLTHSAYSLYIIGILLPPSLSLYFKQQKKLIFTILVSLSVTVAPWIIRNNLAGYHSFNTATGFGQHYFIGWFYYEQLINGKNYFGNVAYHQSFKFAENIAIKNGIKPIITESDRSNLEITSQYDKLASEHLKSHLFENFKKVLIKSPLLWTQQQTITRSLVNLLLLLPFIFLALLTLFLPQKFTIQLLFPVITTSLGFSLVCVECSPMRYALPLFSIIVIISLNQLEFVVNILKKWKKK